MSATVTRFNSSMTLQLPSPQSLLDPLLRSLKITNAPPTKPGAEHVEDVRAEEGDTVTAADEPSSSADNRDEWFIGSIDQGTTSSRFLIFNSEGEPVASHQIEFENKYPRSG
jgi:hypothetical protein